jgi:hypothetical protein
MWCSPTQVQSPPGPPQPGDQLVGTVVAGRFELHALAGAGGMGRVYRAIDRTTDQVVAVKLLPGDGDAMRFAREAAALSVLDHPGIVRHVAHGLSEQGWPYLAMEWLGGEDLAQRLEGGPLTVPETLLVATRVAEALSSAHAHGIVHRDLKPGNLFLAGGRLDDVKLLDFGIARMVEGGDLTVSGTVMGTPQYMSPEQVRGGAVDARADVYGLGAVMFRCLVGQPPFSGAHQIAVLAKIVLEPAPPLRSLRPDVPADLEALVARMLAKEPDERPVDCVALATELRALGEPRSSPLPARVPVAVTTSERRVASVVLSARVSDLETTRPAHGASIEADPVLSTIRERGGVVDELARGAWVVTIPGAASPSEQALRAARCAVALSASRSGSPVYVATGWLLTDGRQTMGEVIDRAADALVVARGRGTLGVWVDATTAELLQGRFRMESGEGWTRLVEEVDAVAPVRTLLGRPTPCVGREPQLAMLATMLGSVTEQRRASGVVVTAEAGLGKTHLISEFLRGGVAADRGVDLLVAQGDPARASSSLAYVGQVLRRAAGIVEADGSTARAAKLSALVPGEGAEAEASREILGEICGVPTSPQEASPALRAARADPSLMADAVREAWLDWMRARASRGTVVLLAEDVHWADAPSLALVEESLRELADLPLFLLASARPGNPRWERLRRGGVMEMTLAPLPSTASEKLARGALGDEVATDVIRGIVRRAGGHPFHLEELIRAVSSGAGTDALPDTVLAMVQVRFEGLDAQTRRVLAGGGRAGHRRRRRAATRGDGARIPRPRRTRRESAWARARARSRGARSRLQRSRALVGDGRACARRGGLGRRSAGRSRGARARHAKARPRGGDAPFGRSALTLLEPAPGERGGVADGAASLPASAVHGRPSKRGIARFRRSWGADARRCVRPGP